jgi:opacity protein-like surface antigen
MELRTGWPKKSCFAFFLVFSSITTSAAVVPKLQVNLYGGVNYTSINKSSLAISPDEVDTLHGGDNSNTFMSGVGLAYDFILSAPTKNNFYLHDISLGVDAFFFNTINSGSVYQYGLPEFNNYNYYLQFKTRRLMLDGTLVFAPIWRGIMPLITAGVGTVNIATKYYDESRDMTGGDISLSDHTVNNFAYSFGVGIRKAITANLHVSALYLYTNLGTARSSVNSNSNNTSIALQEPITAKLTTNTGLIELSWLFG